LKLDISFIIEIQESIVIK